MAIAKPYMATRAGAASTSLILSAGCPECGSVLSATSVSMRDAAELAVEGAATLQRTVRLADADGKHEEHELDDIDRELAAAEAHLAAVRALSMQMRAKVRAQREDSR